MSDELDLSGWEIHFMRDAWGDWSWRAESRNPPAMLQSGPDRPTRAEAESDALSKVTEYERGEDFHIVSGDELQARVRSREPVYRDRSQT